MITFKQNILKRDCLNNNYDITNLANYHINILELVVALGTVSMLKFLQ